LVALFLLSNWLLIYLIVLVHFWYFSFLKTNFLLLSILGHFIQLNWDFSFQPTFIKYFHIYFSVFYQSEVVQNIFQIYMWSFIPHLCFKNFNYLKKISLLIYAELNFVSFFSCKDLHLIFIWLINSLNFLNIFIDN
jgi:hypothetical protein